MFLKLVLIRALFQVSILNILFVLLMYPLSLQEIDASTRLTTVHLTSASTVAHVLTAMEEQAVSANPDMLEISVTGTSTNVPRIHVKMEALV